MLLNSSKHHEESSRCCLSVSIVFFFVGMAFAQVLIPLGSAFLFYIVADATLADELHGLVGITVIVCVISFFVATMFTEVSSVPHGSVQHTER